MGGSRETTALKARRTLAGKRIFFEALAGVDTFSTMK
jgi:hypothetical protein